MLPLISSIAAPIVGNLAGKIMEKGVDMAQQIASQSPLAKLPGVQEAIDGSADRGKAMLASLDGIG
jgi:hypothetical protein